MKLTYSQMAAVLTAVADAQKREGREGWHYPYYRDLNEVRKALAQEMKGGPKEELTTN
jgi:hypothetical protein